jgi:hypothetical protein
MQLIDDISNDPKQKHTITLGGVEGGQAVLQLDYSPVSRGWFIDVAYELDGIEKWNCKGLRITTIYNLLAQFKNIIPFGLNVYCADGGEPMFLHDFLTGRAELGVLNAEEIR